MKKITLGILLAATVPLMCMADFDVSKWKSYKDITIPALGLVRVVLDDDIYSGAKKDLGDLRVTTDTFREVPFKLESGMIAPQENTYTANLINNSFLPGQYSSVIVDLGTNGKIVNNLSIITSSENFQRNAKVSGSDDLNIWNVLKDDGYVYDYTDKKGNFKSQNTRLNFPDSLFRYYKIEISDSDNNPVKISSVTAKQITEKSVREMTRDLYFSSGENREQKATELIADSGVDGLPLSRVTFSIEGENFNRQVLIYASADKERWSNVSRDYIFRYDTAKFIGERLSVGFPETNSRYLKILIINNDDTPLNIVKLSGSSVNRQIVFQSEPNLNYRIYYGNEKAASPQYDLEKFIQYLDVDQAKTGSISGQKSNSAFIPEKEPEKPVSERIPYLLPAVLSLVSLIMIFLVYKFFKN